MYFMNILTYYLYYCAFCGYILFNDFCFAKQNKTLNHLLAISIISGQMCWWMYLDKLCFLFPVGWIIKRLVGLIKPINPGFSPSACSFSPHASLSLSLILFQLLSLIRLFFHRPLSFTPAEVLWCCFAFSIVSFFANSREKQAGGTVLCASVCCAYLCCAFAVLNNIILNRTQV